MIMVCLVIAWIASVSVLLASGVVAFLVAVAVITGAAQLLDLIGGLAGGFIRK